MKMIVDSNYLQSEELRDYLNLSKDNYVILTDYVAMEAYKGDTPVTIFESMKILAGYPNQIIILKDTQTICGLDPKRENLQDHLIDHDQTENFAEFCQNLVKVRKGAPALLQEVIEHGNAANLHMNKMLSDTENLLKAISLIKKEYSRDELRMLRSGIMGTDAISKKLCRHVLELYVMLSRAHPQVSILPESKDMANSFLFRYSLCSYLLAINLVISGRSKPEKIRNDMVDVILATYATFFDGFLSNDRAANKLYQDTRDIVDTVYNSGER